MSLLERLGIAQGCATHKKIQVKNEISDLKRYHYLSLPLVFKYTTNPDTIVEPLAETDFAPRAGSDIQGLWKGTIKFGQTQLRQNLKISEAMDGTIRAEMQSVDQSSQYTPASSMTRNGDIIKISFPGIGGTFEGKLDTVAGQIAGNLKQGGKQAPLTFKRADLQAEQALENSKNYTYASQSDLQGHWKGTLDAKKAKLRLVLHIALMPDGSFSGTLDSLDQGVNGIPADVVQFTLPNVHMEWNGMKVIYDAKLENGKLSGTYRVGSMTFALAFERSGTN